MLVPLNFSINLFSCGASDNFENWSFRVFNAIFTAISQCFVVLTLFSLQLVDVILSAPSFQQQRARIFFQMRYISVFVVF